MYEREALVVVGDWVCFGWGLVFAFVLDMAS